LAEKYTIKKHSLEVTIKKGFKWTVVYNPKEITPVTLKENPRNSRSSEMENKKDTHNMMLRD